MTGIPESSRSPSGAPDEPAQGWRGRPGQHEQVEQARSLLEALAVDMQVAGGGLQRLVSQQRLEREQIDPGFEQVRGVAVP